MTAGRVAGHEPRREPLLYRWGGLLVALAFLAYGWIGLGDYGATQDEPESYLAGHANVDIVAGALRGDTDFEWPWHELPAYQFVFDTARGAFARLVSPLYPLGVPFHGVHLLNLVLASLGIFLAWRIALAVGATPRAALLAAAALASFPKVIAHAQFNPKDMIAFVMFTATLWAVTRATRRGRARDFVVAGVLLGLALSSHVLSFLLLPISAVWILWRAGGPPRRRILRVALLTAIALPSMVAFWPWLWRDPFTRLGEAYAHVSSFTVRMQVLYFGRLYAQDEIPAHYFWGSFLVSTPLLHLAGIVLGLLAALRGTGTTRLAGLALLWIGFPAAAELFASSHYDGVRHYLCIYPAFALLVGAGFDAALQRASAWRAAGARVALAVPALLAAAFVWLLVRLWAIHPYEDAYLNEAVNAVVRERAEDCFELAVWGDAYLEGTRWLHAHAPPGSVVLVPIVNHPVLPYLQGRYVLWTRDDPPAVDRPMYLMFVTRRSHYSDRIRALRAAREPDFRIRRQNATLLEIYAL